MNISGMEKEFVIIGENIHTTRIVLRKGKRVTIDPDGDEAVVYTSVDGQTRYLKIPGKIKQSQNYDEGRIKHIKIAVGAAMNDLDFQAVEGLEYIRQLAQHQEKAGADYLDLNVDEISLKPQDQIAAMRWLVQTVESMSTLALSIDSSNIETIRTGLETCNQSRALPMLNSASLERLDALDLAKEFQAKLIVTAAGGSCMPQGAEERIDHATQVIEAALEKGIAVKDIFIDPLVFPISVDIEFGNHCLAAIKELRRMHGPDIHITGGLSNVSFGMPNRSLINAVFIRLAVDAGADSGIIDPIASNLDQVFALNKECSAYQLTEAMLLGQDRRCKVFLKAHRKGELSLPE